MRIASRRVPRPRPRRPDCLQAETLEPRVLFALAVQIDYSLDRHNFFDTQEKRDLLQAAADAAVGAFRDRLDAIVPGGGNTWKAVIDDPGTGGVIELADLTIPDDTILVFAGGRDMTSLGMGGPGGFNSSGAPSWNDRVANRGQDDARGSGARDFGPWGGSIAFDANPAAGWYFGLDESAIGTNTDFYSVALHEMTHLLGFGTSDSWESRVRGATFTGPAAATEYGAGSGGGGVPLGPDGAHWASNTTHGGREAAMDPDLSNGVRKNLTQLDLAAMDDIGWDVALFAAGNNATYTDATGDLVTVTLRGPGSARLAFGDATGDADATGIVVTGTAAASALTITANGAGTTIGGLTVDGPLRSLTGKSVDLAGALSVSGGVGKLLLRNATGSMTLGAGAAATSVTLAQARDLSVTADSAVKSIKLNEWLDADATPDVLTAPSVGAMSVKGALEAGVVADTIGKLSAGGALRGAAIRATGGIGTVTVGSAADSLIFAGVRPDLSALPDSLDDFANPAAAIKAVTLRGRGAAFSNTRVAAPTVGKAALGSATTGTTTDNPFGLAADRIASVTGATSASGVYKLTKREQPGTGIDSVDFAIVVL